MMYGYRNGAEEETESRGWGVSEVGGGWVYRWSQAREEQEHGSLMGRAWEVVRPSVTRESPWGGCSDGSSDVRAGTHTHMSTHICMHINFPNGLPTRPPSINIFKLSETKREHHPHICLCLFLSLTHSGQYIWLDDVLSTILWTQYGF